VEVILQTFSKSMRIANRHKILVGSAAGILCLAVLAKSSSVTSVTGVQVTTRTWEGTWNNLKHTSDGPLKCVATEVESGLWEGTFTGVFQGDPFTYDATFQARPGRQGTFNLSGTSIIRDHEYQWTGMMRGQELRGRYNSTDGSDGEFVLQAE
jgi:hypothetical protein